MEFQHLFLVQVSVDIPVAYEPSSHRLLRVKVRWYMHKLIAWCSIGLLKSRFRICLQNAMSKDIVSILRRAGQISDANLDNHTARISHVHRRYSNLDQAGMSGARYLARIASNEKQIGGYLASSNIVINISRDVAVIR